MTWMISNMSCTQVKRILQKLTRILEILCFLNLSKRRKLIIQVIWWDYVVCRLLNDAYLLSICIYAQHNRGTISTLSIYSCSPTPFWMYCDNTYKMYVQCPRKALLHIELGFSQVSSDSLLEGENILSGKIVFTVWQKLITSNKLISRYCFKINCILTEVTGSDGSNGPDKGGHTK